MRTKWVTSTMRALCRHPWGAMAVPAIGPSWSPTPFQPGLLPPVELRMRWDSRPRDNPLAWTLGAAVAILAAFPVVSWAGGTHGGQVIPLPGTAVDELGRYRLALAFAAAALAFLVIYAIRGRRNVTRPSNQGGMDVLALPGIGRLLLWRGFPPLLQVPAALLFAALIVAGLAAS